MDIKDLEPIAKIVLGSAVLLHNLRKSRKFKELKSKYESEWINTRKKFITERFETKEKEVNYGSL